MSGLKRVLEPRSVAVVGASTTPGKRGYRTIEDLRSAGYNGDIYPVNPNYEEVLGLKAYPSVSEIPGNVDLAFIAIPAAYVPDAIQDCGEAGVAGAVIYSAGFSEVGRDDLEEELIENAQEYGVRIIGPNIQGVENVHLGLDLLGMISMPPGELGLLTQSGLMGESLAVDAIDTGTVGFSFNIGVGNEVDIKFHEYVEYLRDHEQTNGLVLYVEGMEAGRAFLQEARDTVREKPIVAFKAGRTSAGKRSAESHTASLAGDIEVLEAGYRQAGVTFMRSIDMVVPVAEALTTQPAPAGMNVGILTDGGGYGTVATDAITEAGLSLPEPTEDTQEALLELMPGIPNVSNPIDVMGQFEHTTMWNSAPRVLLEDPNIDMLLVTGGVGGYAEEWSNPNVPVDTESESYQNELKAMKGLVEVANEYDKPVVVLSTVAELETAALGVLRDGGIPVYENFDEMTAALSELARYGQHLQHADEKTDFELQKEGNPHPIITEAAETGEALSEYDARTVLADAGAPVIPFSLVTSHAEAEATAQEYESPLAMKIVSPDIVHKTEAGGVALDVDAASVTETYDQLVDSATQYNPNAAIDGVMVSPMAGGEHELIVGVVDDEEVGPVLMTGLGGVFTEVLEDIAFRVLPVTEHDAAEMLDELQASEILSGARSGESVDKKAIVDFLMTVSDVIEANPEISELDINPVFVDANGVRIADAHIILD